MLITFALTISILVNEYFKNKRFVLFKMFFLCPDTLHCTVKIVAYSSV